MNNKEIDLQRFNKDYMTSINDVLNALNNTRSLYEKKYRDYDGLKKKRYYIFLGYIDEFIKEIKNSKYLELNPWWFYSYLITPKKMVLSLYYLVSEQGTHSEYKKLYDLNIINIKSLDVEEYAKKYDVELVTVRQWIRRDKGARIY